MLFLLNDSWDGPLVGGIQVIVAQSGIIWQRFSSQSFEVIRVDAIVVSAHTTDQVLHCRWSEYKYGRMTIVQQLQFRNSSNQDV
jgi:hypothetical protein